MNLSGLSHQPQNLLLPDLDRVQHLRQDMGDRLEAIADLLKQVETTGTHTSGKLELSHHITSLNTASTTLRQGVFRHYYDPQAASIWVDGVADMFSAIPGGLNSTINSFNRFWQGVLSYMCAAIALQIVGVIFMGFSLNVFAVLLAGTGVFAIQAEVTRQQFLTKTKQEFAKYLPQIADEQYGLIQHSVKRCFEAYAEESKTRIDQDIQSRKAELDNLLAQKTTREIDREQEIQRLKRAGSNVMAEMTRIKGAIG
jgi:hypothetical protein